MMGRSSAEIEDEEEEGESASAQNPEVRYDVELPGTHSYLGNDLEVSVQCPWVSFKLMNVGKNEK